jgi:hypothetical protein
MGPTALLPLRRKLCFGFLSPLKIHRPRSGSNPRTLGPVQSNNKYCYYRWLVASLSQRRFEFGPQAVKLSLSKPRRHILGENVWLHSFITSALDGGEWATSRPSRFTARKIRVPITLQAAWDEGASQLYMQDSREVTKQNH